MNVVWLLFRNNSRKTLAIIALGLLSGAASTALIAAANDSLYSGSGISHARWLLALAFVVAVTFKVGSTIASGLLLGHSVQDIMLNMCEGLCRRIAATPLTKLEEIGGPRVMACLTDDVEVLSAAANVIPNLMVDVAMMAGCGIYLAWISWRAAITMVALVVVVVITYRFLLAKAQTAVRLARDSRDTLFQHFRSLVEGIKEIKLHNNRKNAFFDEDVDGTVQYLRQQNVVAMHRYALADAWSQTMYYMLLGVVLFAFPALHHVSLKTLTAYVFMALYMMGPILGIAGCIPYFNRGQASLQKLQELGMALDDIGEIQMAPRDSQPKPARIMTHSPGIPPLVEFRDVVFHHGHEKKGNSFTLGPLSLTLHPGELVFIIGGNGSGKSTLAKLMTGLYAPDSGEILVNGISVSADSQDEYRQLYSAVFSDFYLFDRLLGLDKSAEWAERSKEYLDALGLSHVVKMKGASFSTISLSQGQRRRMALLVAYLEDRPIYVLDEWAADQDPAFRQIFYLKLLPALKEKGKTVVLITHDDRFFHLGDRVIKLDYGKVIETVQQGVPAESVQI